MQGCAAYLLCLSFYLLEQRVDEVLQGVILDLQHQHETRLGNLDGRHIAIPAAELLYCNFTFKIWIVASKISFKTLSSGRSFVKSARRLSLLSCRIKISFNPLGCRRGKTSRFSRKFNLLRVRIEAFFKALGCSQNIIKPARINPLYSVYIQGL